MSHPSPLILDNYAEVLVNFALHGGKGVQPGEVVECLFPESAKPLALAIYTQLLKSGAHAWMQMQPAGFEKVFYEVGQSHQWQFFPEDFHRAKASVIAHHIYIIDPTVGELLPHHVGPKELHRQAHKAFHHWLDHKGLQGNYSWTMAIWPSTQAANRVGLSLEEYWHEVIQACRLECDDPLMEWRHIFGELHQTCNELDSLHLRKLHIEGEDIDLHLEIPSNRKWLGGRGRNIPSYEVFTSPDCDTTHGWMRANQPIIRNDALITKPEFYFEAGQLTKFSAKSGHDSLAIFLATPGMDRVGEVSLTDKKMSHIHRPLGVTLFDENMGGAHGNFHLALGNSFRDAFNGVAKPENDQEWVDQGFNNSKLHIDFVSTSDRIVTATLKSGEERVIYRDGSFFLD